MDAATSPSSFINPHSLKNRLGRLLWAVVWATLFRPSPWFMNGWRRFLLRLFGAQIGHAEFKPSVRVWAPWRLKIGHHVYFDRDVYLYNAFGMEFESQIVVSFGAVLCTATHDYTKPDFPLIGEPIVVKSDSWIAAEAFVMPGVTVGQGAVVGARALVRKDVPAWSIVSGNPGKVVGTRAIEGGGR